MLSQSDELKSKDATIAILHGEIDAFDRWKAKMTAELEQVRADSDRTTLLTPH